MVNAGDEIGHSQQGNNNAYCQDNEIGWLDWRLDAERKAFLAFIQRVIRLRAEHDVFRRKDFYAGKPQGAGGLKDVVWLRPDGAELTRRDWENSDLRAFSCAFGGSRRYALLFNPTNESVSFLLPQREGAPWQALVDTSAPDGAGGALQSGGAYALIAYSLVLVAEQS
jgi:glycogen operon protein